MAVKIFFCYAHEDEALLKKLQAQLRLLQRQGLIDLWYDRDISAGTEWEPEISQHLKAADIILLLISPEFMNSDYCYSIEMKQALERYQRGEAEVIPVILYYVHWQGEPLGKLQALPTDAKPVTAASLHSLNEALFDVVEGVRIAVEKIITKNAAIIVSTHLRPSLNEQVSLWLKARASNSTQTWEAYEESIREFRDVLHKNSLDLDSEDEAAISSLAKGWAKSSKRKKEVEPRTHNQRLSAISSFYKFAREQGWMKNNPIEKVPRLKEPDGNIGVLLDFEKVKIALKSIDRSNLLGKRDYALILILYTTERPVSEVKALRCGDITRGESSLTLTFQRGKGGKTIPPVTVPNPAAQALIDYLVEVYGNEWPHDAPAWVSCSNNGRGKAIGYRAIAGVCERYLDISRVERIRLSVAAMRREVGAGIRAKEIAKMLDIG